MTGRSASSLPVCSSNTSEASPPDAERQRRRSHAERGNEIVPGNEIVRLPLFSGGLWRGGLQVAEERFAATQNVKLQRAERVQLGMIEYEVDVV